MPMPKCEECGRELKPGETAYQGDLVHDLTKSPPKTRVPYWCEEHGKEKG